MEGVIPTTLGLSVSVNPGSFMNSAHKCTLSSLNIQNMNNPDFYWYYDFYSINHKHCDLLIKQYTCFMKQPIMTTDITL